MPVRRRPLVIAITVLQTHADEMLLSTVASSASQGPAGTHLLGLERLQVVSQKVHILLQKGGHPAGADALGLLVSEMYMQADAQPTHHRTAIAGIIKEECLELARGPIDGDLVLLKQG